MHCIGILYSFEFSSWVKFFQIKCKLPYKPDILKADKIQNYRFSLFFCFSAFKNFNTSS